MSSYVEQKLRLPPIFFWLHQPPKVGRGAFNYLSKIWPNNVYYVCTHDFSNERLMTNWGFGNYADAKVIILSKYAKADEMALHIALNNRGAIHIFGGIYGAIHNKYLKLICKTIVNPNIVIFLERPFVYGNPVEKTTMKILKYLKYAWFNVIFGHCIKALCPLGLSGCKEYGVCGWNKNKIFNFMYCPDYECVDIVQSIHVPVKFLYIGRFNKNSKGLDVLLEAIKDLDRSIQLSIDFVGGYGAMKDELLDCIKNDERLNYAGVWEFDDVLHNMISYDVALVPSRYDGWNLTPNEAINAGLGVIASNGAVSDELVSTSGCGLVVQAGDVVALKNAIEYAVLHPSEVEKWKGRSLGYAARISPETVGNYLKDIITYSCFGQGSKPKCPWLDD